MLIAAARRARRARRRAPRGGPRRARRRRASSASARRDRGRAARRRPARARRSGSRCRRRPRRPRAGRLQPQLPRRRPSRAPPRARRVSATWPDRVGGAVDGADLGRGQLLAQEAARTARSPAGGRRRPRSRRARMPSRAISAWRISVVELADDPRRPSASKASASRVGRTVPSIEFSNGTKPRSAPPSSTAMIASWIVAAGRARSGALAGGEPQRLLREGPGGSEVGDPHGCGLAHPAGSRPSRARLLHRLELLGGEVEGGAAVEDRLRVDARLLALQDRGDDDAGVAVVEQRDGARLPAGSLVEGVVADHRGLRDGAVEALLGRRRGARCSAPTSASSASCMPSTRRGQPGRVLDQVLLRSPSTRRCSPRTRRSRSARNAQSSRDISGDPAGGEGDDPDGRVQLVQRG